MTPATVLHRGCSLSYAVRGDGPAVLFVQGVGAAGSGWTPQVEGLAGRFRCVTFDNRGVGRSVPAGGPITIEQMADDARAVLDAAGVEAAHVVGHSLGGPVVLQLAVAARPRVRSLALLCTFARGKSAAPLAARMVWAGLRAQVGPRRWRRRAFLELLLPPAALRGIDRDALAASLAPLFGHDLADHGPTEGEQLRALRAFDATPRLAELAGLPTLVASATHDLIAPPALGRALAAAIPGATFAELPDAAHGAPISDAARVNELLAKHFAAAGPYP